MSQTLTIRLYGDPILRKPAMPVTTFDEHLRALAEAMQRTMVEANGVGLAAPQVGVPFRLLLATELHETASDDEPDNAITHVLVNPTISERSGLQHGVDGCLSVPGIWFEDMPRDDRVVVNYQDLQGDPGTLTAEGHFAHVLQHEIDHLNGVLYFDRLEGDAKKTFLEEHRSELADIQREAKRIVRTVGPTFDAGVR